jgi:FMN phosphatase YigB (HAD superfamily)
MSVVIRGRFGRNKVNLKDVWSEQSDFNKLFRNLPDSFEQKSDVTQHLVLCIMSELNEILNTVQWKHHRKTDIRPNPQQTLSECIDVFKYLVSIAQVWGFSEEDFFRTFWKKSMVVRQRYSEEWVKSIKGKTAIIDIDGVLCDYRTGFLDWVSAHRPDLSEYVDKLRLDECHYMLTRKNFNLSTERWQDMKHEFRISGAKENLPVYPDAKDFMRKLKECGIVSVLLTSRPIDRYPNLYGDTVSWLKKNDLYHDVVWWSYDKADKALERLANPIFAVDDDTTYINKFADAGIQTFWVCRNGGAAEEEYQLHSTSSRDYSNRPITAVQTLTDIPLGDYDDRLR